jgi:carotenoid cleavage dioxygenase-like enzyme
LKKDTYDSILFTLKSIIKAKATFKMPLEVKRKLEPPKSPKLFRTQIESPKVEESVIKGDVPSWLRGTYLRVGPGKFDFDKDFAVNHILDGYALISKFEIQGNGKVRYEKKFLESDAYKKALLAQKPVIGEFGTKSSPDPTKGFFSKMIPSLVRGNKYLH